MVITTYYIEVSFYILTTWWVSELVDQWVPEGTCSQVLRSTSVVSLLLRASIFFVLKIDWNYNFVGLLHHSFCFSLFWHVWDISFQLLKLLFWLRITDEGSVPEMRIWSILFIKSDLKWWMQLSRSPFLHLYRGVKEKHITFYPLTIKQQNAKQYKPKSKKMKDVTVNMHSVYIPFRSRRWLDSWTAKQLFELWIFQADHSKEQEQQIWRTFYHKWQFGLSEFPVYFSILCIESYTLMKCDSILIFTSFYNKVCRGIAYFNSKISYLSDFKRTKSKTLRAASTGRMTNWTKQPCDPVQLTRTKDWYI